MTSFSIQVLDCLQYQLFLNGGFIALVVMDLKCINLKWLPYVAVSYYYAVGGVYDMATAWPTEE